MATTAELGRELERLRAEMHGLYKAAETGKFDVIVQDGKEIQVPIWDMDKQTIIEVRRREDELAEKEQKFQASRLADTFRQNEEAMKGLDRPAGRIQHQIGGGDYGGGRGAGIDDLGLPLRRSREEQLSLGERVLLSREYKQRASARRNQFSVEFNDVDVKTLLQTTTSYAPPNPRTGVVIGYPQRRPLLPDLIPTSPTSLQIVKFMRETTETNAAAHTSEGSAKPESAFAWTEQSAPVVKIAHWVPVTEEQVDDVAGFESLLNERMMLLLQLKFEDELLNGPGTPSTRMQGFYNASIGTQSQGSDQLQDAIFKAMQKVRWTGFAEPGPVLIHPDDWTPIRLARAVMYSGGTAGLYLYGAPSEVGPETLFGKQVIQTPAITASHPIVGDWALYSHISLAMAVRVDVSDSHSDYFVRNILAVRCEMKASLEILRPTAFVQVVA